MVCSAKKQIVMEIIDVILKKDRQNRNYVALNLDTLMAETNSNVSKMLKN